MTEFDGKVALATGSGLDEGEPGRSAPAVGLPPNRDSPR